MTDTTKTTPTPWAYAVNDGRREIYYNDESVFPRVALIDDNTDDDQQTGDAELIVRAVNNHASLVSILGAVLLVMQTDGTPQIFSDASLAEMRDVYAKAKG